MKHCKTVIVSLLFFSSLSIHAFALPLAFRAAGFVASRAFALAKNARPLARQAKNYLQNSRVINKAAHKAFCVSEPYLAKAEIWALEHPKEAAAGITGGLIGWETSDKGIINTVTGVATGVITGVTLCGYSGMRTGYQAAVAEAKAAREALCVMRTSHQVTLTELQTARTSNGALAQEVMQLKDRYGKTSTQLAAFKKAAQSVNIQKSEGNTTLESCKTLWELSKLSGRKVALARSAFPVLAVA